MTNTLKVKEELFKEEIFYFKEYQNEMLQEFFDYWSEPNRSGSKMKFELEKTWDHSRRLKRWFNNQKKWNGNTTRTIKTLSGKYQATGTGGY